MQFYLSSYKMGNRGKKLQNMTKNCNKKVAYIANALDFATDMEKRSKSEAMDIKDLMNLGFTIKKFNLRDYFLKSDKLREDLTQCDVIWVRGGNVFVLRQAMKLSGFDDLLMDLYVKEVDVLYGGYSAGACILSPTLKGLEIVDDINQMPYPQLTKPIEKGLEILDFQFVPHYKSEDHPETKKIDKLVEYYIKNKILFKALSDGEVIIMNNN